MRILKQEYRPYKPMCDIYRNPERTFLRIDLDLPRATEEYEIDRLRMVLSRWAKAQGLGELAEAIETELD